MSNNKKILNILALLTLFTTLLLVVAGGIVTSTGSGLAVPDWPTTFGENMFLYPIAKMLQDRGVFFEHSHRLIGSLVGLMTVALTIGIWLIDQRKWLKWLGLVALIGVIIQGILGGLRVTEKNILLAIIHGCAAQAFLALIGSIATFTSIEWTNEVQKFEISGRLRRLSILVVTFIYIQLIFGAILRHTGTRLDAHLTFAFLVALHIIFIARRVLDQHIDRNEIVIPTAILVALLILQLTLGLGAYLVKFMLGDSIAYFMRMAILTGHMFIGALMLLSSVLLTLRLHYYSSIDATADISA